MKRLLIILLWILNSYILSAEIYDDKGFLKLEEKQSLKNSLMEIKNRTGLDVTVNFKYDNEIGGSYPDSKEKQVILDIIHGPNHLFFIKSNITKDVLSKPKHLELKNQIDYERQLKERKYQEIVEDFVSKVIALKNRPKEKLIPDQTSKEVQEKLKEEHLNKNKNDNTQNNIGERLIFSISTLLFIIFIYSLLFYTKTKEYICLILKEIIRFIVRVIIKIAKK